MRYVAWCQRHGLAIVLAHVAAVGLALYLIAFHLPLYADFSYLLPEDTPSVRALRTLETRVNAHDFVIAVVQAPTAGERAAATRELFAAMPRDGVERVDASDADARAASPLADGNLGQALALIDNDLSMFRELALDRFPSGPIAHVFVQR